MQMKIEFSLIFVSTIYFSVLFTLLFTWFPCQLVLHVFYKISSTFAFEPQLSYKFLIAELDAS